MNIKVMYHSATGNTKKIAVAIAGALNVSAELITESTAFTEPVDLLFIGDGIYFAKMHKKTQKFIDNLDASMVKNAAVFGTYGGQDKAVAAMKNLLKGKGIKTSNESYACKGQSWLLLNRNHPDANDLDKAGQFALKQVKSI